jgi:hypothetical protein
MEYGFVQSIAMPFIGTSPDGVMHMTYANGVVNRHTLEFKCKCKGWWRNLWPTGEWPMSDLYKEVHLPNGNVLPIPTEYYIQIMWCSFVMGKHSLDDIFKVEGHPKHFYLFKKFMTPFVKKARERGIKHYGEDMLDADVPIMFVTWAPGNTDTPHVGEPEIYMRSCYDPALETHRSVMVKCPSGCIQMTMVDYDHEFIMKVLQHAYYSWRHHWLPRLAMKEHGMLLEGEVDPPMNCFTNPDTDSEEETSLDEDSDSTEDPDM